MKTCKLPTLLALLLAALLAFGCAAPAAAPQATPEAAAPTPDATTEATPEAAPESAQPQAPIRVATLMGPTGMGMASMMAANDAGETAQAYEFTVASAPDEIVGKIVSGEVDIAAAPINLAASLYAKTEGGVAMLAVNTLGVLYVLEDGESVQSVADLAGKTLYATGQGSTPEYILNYLLEQNGIAAEVHVEYAAEHAELAALLASGEVTLGMLPEPNVTATLLKNDRLRVALDLTEEWDAVAGGTQLVQGCIIARRALLDENPEAVSAFLADYAASVEAVNADPAAAGALIEQYGVMPSAAAATKAIPNANIVCITGDAMQQSAAAMFEVLFAANPQSIGGAIPDEGLYYLG